MMRAIAERHRGLLPLDTVETIWRIIISTFTYVQAPYSVHIDVSRGDAAMRDSARFHFGFTVPCETHRSAAEVIDAVARSVGDLGMFALEGSPGAGAWWTALVPPGAPKVIARLPFVERPDHPTRVPAFVLSNPLAEGTARDVVLEFDHARSLATGYSWSLARNRRGSHRLCRCRCRPRFAGRPAWDECVRNGQGSVAVRGRRRRTKRGSRVSCPPISRASVAWVSCFGLARRHRNNNEI